MPASSTYTPIATFTTVNNTTTSYTFSSIPATYTDLVIIGDVRATSSSSIVLRMNSDSGSNYWSYVQYTSGTSVTSTRYINQTTGYVNYNGLPFTSGVWATMQIDIMNYANTNMWKAYYSQTASYTFGSDITAGQWRSTSAVNSVTLFAGSFFDTGTTFTLYGITAA
jgi:hypothetical protein